MMVSSKTAALDLLLYGRLPDADPLAAKALRFEESRQTEKLVMIPSESLAPRAVMEALGTVFTNLYAEGYPSPRTLMETEELLGDVEMEAALHRRFADRRYYKGTDFANVVEALARHRIAELFATDGDPDHGAPVRAEDIEANVQALSGAAANNAVYEALLEHGDTLMGMNLSHGGHLTHGSPYNRSGRYFNVVSYGVSPATGRLDYDEIERLAGESRPRLIVAGASAYPWTIDWRRLREIADSVPGRAKLLADIAHPAGLVVGGQFPNPIGYADVVTFTTHKTMLGPRGAVILSTHPQIAKAIDRAVFPGEQGGPHLNNIFAMAVAFKLARSAEFSDLQRRIVANAVALADGLKQRGLTLAYGGTNTHLLLIDLNGIKTPTGAPLKGDVAARILDLCGVVCNKNTIPGDLNAAHSSAVRLGTVWVTQRGMDDSQMDRLAGIVHAVLANVHTFSFAGTSGPLWRGKVDFPVLREATEGVRQMVAELRQGDDETDLKTGRAPSAEETGGLSALEVRGARAGAFLHEATTADVLALNPGDWAPALIADADGTVVAEVAVLRSTDDGALGSYQVIVNTERAYALEEWFEALSDGYTRFDPDEVLAKVQGPVVITDLGDLARLADAQTEVGRALSEWRQGGASLASDGKGTLVALAKRRREAVAAGKPFFVGRSRLPRQSGGAKPAFVHEPYAGEPRRSCLYEEHLKLTPARNLVPFAGWSMPVWYTSIGEEHRAVRESAGLFDVSHMGVLEVRGEHAARFLDLVTTNYVPSLKRGQAQYAYLLQPDGSVIDDVLIYCLEPDRFMLVVNASNAEKDLAWLEAVNDRRAAIDPDEPAREVDVRVEIRDLKAQSSGHQRRVDLSIQGPASLAVLRKVIGDEKTRRELVRLRRSEFLRADLGGIDTIVSRTGYTGEEYGYELYLHPDRAPEAWRLLLAEGAEFGLKPAGLGARDSTRTEAGFPLYGHELGGPYDVGPAAAGYASFVKLHKGFFIGRAAYIATEKARRMEVVRFAIKARGVRMAKTGDPVVSKRGEAIGYVTSAVAIDGAQVGLAYVDSRHAGIETSLGVFPLPRERGRGGEPAKSDLKPGDRLLLHEEAVVLSRFPARPVKAEPKAGVGS